MQARMTRARRKALRIRKAVGRSRFVCEMSESTSRTFYTNDNPSNSNDPSKSLALNHIDHN
jgi:hypothetical protein